MNVWEVTAENMEWLPPWQTSMVVTVNPDIEEALSVYRSNVTSGNVTTIKLIGSAFSDRKLEGVNT